MRIFLFLVLCLGLPLRAVAADGVLEINQTCAVNTGCFPGDTAGFPVTIQPSAGRSFRLTSDLGPLAPNQSGIVVSTNNAILDLAGFRIYGATTCSPVPVTCSPLGTGIGVLGGSDLVVKDGTIQGMGADGVRLDYSSSAINLHLFHNGGDGVEFGSDGIGTSNHSTSNGVDGIRCAEGCILTGNSVVANGAIGIEGGEGGVIRDNSVRGNGGIGISGAAGGVGTPRPLASNNVLTRNGSISIAGCAIRENLMVGSFFPFTSSTIDLGNNVCNNGGPCQ